jgi:hypothetical protein
MCSAYDWYDYDAKLSRPRTPIFREKCYAAFEPVCNENAN